MTLITQTAFLTLSGIGDGQPLPALGPASITIGDGVPAPAVEGEDAQIVFPVTADRVAVDAPVLVSFHTEDIEAVAGEDYVARSETLAEVIAVGQSAGQIVVTVINDDDYEAAAETFGLVATAASYNGAALTITEDTGIGTIESDDPIIAQQMVLTIYGDSTSVDGGDAPWDIQTSYPYLMMAHYEADGFPVCTSSMYGSHNLGVGSDSRKTIISGSWGNLTTGIEGMGRGYTATAANTGDAEFAFDPSPAQFDQVQVMLLNNGSGAEDVDIKVDGVVVVDGLDTSTLGQFSIQTLSVPLGTHEVSIVRKVESSGALFLQGFRCTDTTTPSVELRHLGLWSATIDKFDANSSDWDIHQAMDQTEPSTQKIIDLQINDSGTPDTDKTPYQNSLRAIYDEAEEDGADVVLVHSMPMPPGSIWADTIELKRTWAEEVAAEYAATVTTAIVNTHIELCGEGTNAEQHAVGLSLGYYDGSSDPHNSAALNVDKAALVYAASRALLDARLAA